jgi:hypothetical protein
VVPYKRNQVEEAILRTLGAKEARAAEVKLRLHRLLVIDRRLGRGKRIRGYAGGRYAFYSQEPPGSGVEVMFSGYEAFALLVAIMLLEHGFRQAGVVRIMREVRPDLQAAYGETLRKDASKLFDPEAVRAMARPGMLATDNTDPVFLAFVNLTGSSAGNGKVRAAISVCRGHEELSAFVKKHSVSGLGATFFELVGLMHRFAGNLSQTRPIKRGRSTV